LQRSRSLPSAFASGLPLGVNPLTVVSRARERALRGVSQNVFSLVAQFVETQWGYGMGDHGEVVEWLELVCMCANVLCWLSLQSAPVPIKGTPQVVQVGALKPTTQHKQLARARARAHSKSKRSPNQSIRDQSKVHANQSIRSARTEYVKSQNFHSKSHGDKC